ncbi:MAG: dipeptide ABC transporter ATP-binding protein [Spirochaetota bacterium]
MPNPVISVEDLSVEYRIGSRWMSAIHDVDLAINPLQIHGLVGESGSGKSTLGLAMMRYLARNARITAGAIRFGDDDLRTVGEREIERVWGAQIGLVPQNPMDALNPSLRISRQMTEITRLHLGLSASEAAGRAIEALEHVQIADPQRVITRYPHQLSGGMLQRVMVAMALSTRPRLLVLDEPTTALDVTTQAVILDLLRDLIHEEEAAALYVSHDLGTVAQLCDFVTVLYAGEVMESAPVGELFSRPRHPYTAGLLACLPSSAHVEESRLATIEGVAPSLAGRGPACVFAPRCPLATDQCRNEKPPLEDTGDGRLVRCWRWREIESGELVPFPGSEERHEDSAPRSGWVLHATGMAKRFGSRTLVHRITRQTPDYVQALDDVSVHVFERSTFGLVGESGSGKTTLARTLLALVEADTGEIRLQDRPVSLRLRDRDRQTLRELRIVFQNPNDSLNPYRTVGQTIGRTIRKLGRSGYGGIALAGGTAADDPASLRRQVEHLLVAVGLSEDYYDRRPTQLSGGEKQRVAVARAFAPHPALIVADEPTSSLDVSVQAVILNLLKDLRAREGASYIVISHDLEVVSYLSDHIAVMYLGEIVEQGSNADVNSFPSHPYTEALLSAAPVPDPAVRHEPITLEGDVPSPRERPTGCPFHTRCPRKIGRVCETDRPPVRADENGHEIRCHYTFEELKRMQSEGRP